MPTTTDSRCNPLVDPAPARRFLVLALALLACLLGWWIAHGSLTLPALLAAGLGLTALCALTSIEAGALTTGAALVGYLVGNRGFAQLNIPDWPIFPGEIALLIAVCGLAFSCALAKKLPFRKDLLNLLLLVWILVASARLRLDVRAHGFNAVRDFAMVYYAVFFFCAQEWATNERSVRWLGKCLTLGLSLCAPAFILFYFATDWLTSTFTLGGTPLIYVKSDIAGGFMVAALIVASERLLRGKRLLWLPTALYALAGVALANSRAALVSLLLCTVWLLVFRHTRLLRIVFLLLAAGLAVVVSSALIGSKPLEQTQLYRLLEVGASITDIEGTATYSSAYTSDKPDNNRFRMTWWTAVVRQTTSEAPWTGLGFGSDLSDAFLKAYFPTGAADFTARSPHNVLVTTYGRMGLLGLLPLLGVFACIISAIWRAGRLASQLPDERRLFAWWLCLWAILITALFGVVLESPVAAIPFWVLLGLANGLLHQRTQNQIEPNEVPAKTQAPSP